MDGFEGQSALTTWLTRIVINEALARRRTAERRARLYREQQIADIEIYRERFMASTAATESPEADVMRRQVAKLLERAIANLPEVFRPVFVLREIEGLSVEETAEVLQIPGETV